MLNTSRHTTPSLPQGLWERRQLIGFLAAFFLAGSAFGMAALALPFYAISMHAKTWIVGAVQTALMLGLLVTILPAGFMVERFGWRRLFIFSSIAMGALVATIPLLPKPIYLLPVVLLMGAFGSFNSAAVNTAFFNQLKKMGCKQAGWGKGAWTIGLSLVGPLVTGFVMRSFGLPAVFNVIAAVWFTQGFAACFLTADRLFGAKREATRNTDLLQIKQLVTNRPLMGAAALEGICTGTISTFSTFVTLLIIRKLDLGVGAAAFVISIQGAGYASVLFIGAKRFCRLTHLQMRIIGFGGAGAAFAVFATAPDVIWVAAAALLLGPALGLLSLTNIAPLVKSDTARGPKIGIFGLGRHTFAFAGIFVAVVASRVGGVTTVFWGFLVLFLALALIVSTATHAPKMARRLS